MLSDKRTRALRTGISWAKQDSWEDVTTSNLTLSGGLDALRARRGSVLAGDREFFKGNLLLGREQAPL